MSHCLFCRISAGDIPSNAVKSDDDLYAFRDISPQAPVHVLVIPRRHVATVNDLSDADAALVGRMVLFAKSIAKDEGIAESGYRLVFNCNAGAGQTVFHVHLHRPGCRVMPCPPG